MLKECWRLELMPTEDYLRAHDLEAIRGSSLPRGRTLSRGEVRALFEALAKDEQPIARRDAAALGLLVGGGVRRSELAHLLREDVRTRDWPGGGAQVTFLTDGGEDVRELPLYLNPQAEHLIDWFHITMR